MFSNKSNLAKKTTGCHKHKITILTEIWHISKCHYSAFQWTFIIQAFSTQHRRKMLENCIFVIPDPPWMAKWMIWLEINRGFLWLFMCSLFIVH